METPRPELWYAALASRRGVRITVDDPTSVRQKLYLIRKSLNDPDLAKISVMTSRTNPDGEVWLVKKET